MMGPEAALVAARLAELRGMGGYVGPMPPVASPMYAEAAVQAHLEPPEVRAGPWARLRAALHGRGGRRAEPRAAWTVAAAPVLMKEERAALRDDVPLAAVPLRWAARP
jgi:hypothetical protein